MRVGEIAERAGMNVETLRHHERRGLLPAPDRTPSGHRRYDEETVRFLHAIKEAQAVGFMLAENAEYLRAVRRSGAPSEALRARMATTIDQIDARIAALRRMRDDLARVVGCACISLDHCTGGTAYISSRGRDAVRGRQNGAVESRPGDDPLPDAHARGFSLPSPLGPADTVHDGNNSSVIRADHAYRIADAQRCVSCRRLGHVSVSRGAPEPPPCSIRRTRSGRGR